MDLTDVTQRIFRRHWALILLLALIGAAAPLLLMQVQGPNYVATARFVIGDDGQAKSDATSQADTALGLATSPVVLEKVLKQTKVHEDPVIVATEVTVTPVGTSGVLDLAVTDSSARAAAAIANGLVVEVVAERQATLRGGTQALLVQSNAQIQQVNARIAVIESASHGYLTPGDSAALAMRLTDALAIRGNLLNQRQQLSQQLASSPGAKVIDDSMSNGVTDTSTLPAKIAVGALLGLILGIAIAATREATRPTYDPGALGRHFDAPLLGRLTRAPTEHTTLDDPLLASYVRIASEEAGVPSVQLVPVGRRKIDVSGLARSLREGGRDAVPLVLPRKRQVEPGSGWLTRHDAGIIVIAPKVVRSRFLAALDRHLQVTNQRVIGVITYSGRRDARPRVEMETTEIPEQQTATPQQAAPSVATVS